MGLDDVIALIGLPLKRRSASKLSAAADEILASVFSFIDELLLRAIAARTKSEFAAIRKQVIGKYAGAFNSVAKLVKIIVQESVIERALVESFCELEAEFREHGLDRFGAPARDQAMFTIWTLRRMSRLISEIISSGPVPETIKERDEEIAGAFSAHTAWAQFHLDCLLIAIRREKTIQIDVLPEIINGLRAAVDAYGYARQGLKLRVPEGEPLMPAYEWDAEDQELLNSSMRDMEVDFGAREDLPTPAFEE